MMVFKTRKAYIEAVEMSMHNMDEIRDFCGVEYKVCYAEKGWFSVTKHKNDYRIYVKDGDYLIKTDSGIVCSVDRQDFEKLYQKVTEC